MNLSFSKRVGKTLVNGQITVPKEFDSILDKKNCCALGLSIDITYILPNGLQIPGRLYQSENNTTSYYQFYIIESDDKKFFKGQINNYSVLNFDFNLLNLCLYVTSWWIYKTFSWMNNDVFHFIASGKCEKENLDKVGLRL